jgi:hypothetical protein
MKRTNYFFHMLIALGLCGLMYCADDGATKDGVSKDAQGYNDSATNNNDDSDSLNAAHNRDPSTAYPQPPVTGSNQDSSRLKDTPNRPGY